MPMPMHVVRVRNRLTEALTRSQALSWAYRQKLTPRRTGSAS
jgi:hypothetical protein